MLNGRTGTLITVTSAMTPTQDSQRFRRVRVWVIAQTVSIILFDEHRKALEVIAADRSRLLKHIRELIDSAHGGFATKPTLALAMIERAIGANVPFSFVARRRLHKGNYGRAGF